MKRTAWIWLLGCAAWTVDAAVNLTEHSLPHAELAFLLAVLFAIAWLFYRSSPR